MFEGSHATASLEIKNEMIIKEREREREKKEDMTTTIKTFL
jgi:hypothetical protein